MSVFATQPVALACAGLPCRATERVTTPRHVGRTLNTVHGARRAATTILVRPRAEPESGEQRSPVATEQETPAPSPPQEATPSTDGAPKPPAPKATPPENVFPATPQAQRNEDRSIVLGATFVLVSLVTAAFTVGRDAIDDILYSMVMSGGVDSSFGAGDTAAAILWSISLYFVSPIQLLLLFLGKIETERPSDEFLYLLGRLTNQDVDAVDYDAPLPLRAIVILGSIVSGFTVAWICEAGLGDSTWGVAGGIGSLMAAGVYEVGRPKRLDPQEAMKLEAQWQDFARFADERMQRSGRCHESEIQKAFRRTYAKYRDPSVVPDDVLRDMVRNWAPNVSRTASGYYKGVSLIPKADPFQ